MTKTQVSVYSIVLVILLTGFILLQRLDKRDKMRRGINILLFGTYIFAVLWITLISRPTQSERAVLLTPFESYLSAFESYKANYAAAAKDGVITSIERIRSFLYGYNWTILNVYLFIPYGVMASSIFYWCRGWRLIAYGICASVFIELLQYIFKAGCMDIDDVINNAVGIFIGYAIARLFRVCFEGNKDWNHAVERSGRRAD